jgi:hypothetical protein
MARPSFAVAIAGWQSPEEIVQTAKIARDREPMMLRRSRCCSNVSGFIPAARCGPNMSLRIQLLSPMKRRTPPWEWRFSYRDYTLFDLKGDVSGHLYARTG